MGFLNKFCSYAGVEISKSFVNRAIIKIFTTPPITYKEKKQQFSLMPNLTTRCHIVSKSMFCISNPANIHQGPNGTDSSPKRGFFLSQGRWKVPKSGVASTISKTLIRSSALWNPHFIQSGEFWGSQWPLWSLLFRRPCVVSSQKCSSIYKVWYLL